MSNYWWCFKNHTTKKEFVSNDRTYFLTHITEQLAIRVPDIHLNELKETMQPIINQPMQTSEGVYQYISMGVENKDEGIVFPIPMSCIND